jgi:uncharacterized protein YndB with AHSA1/START domain
MPDIMHMLTIAAPPERVYQALTTAEGIRAWWTREAELDGQVGGAGEFRFYGGRVVTTVTVDARTPPAHVGWRTVASTAPGGWVGTTIAFDLRAEGSGTVLLFAHRGFKEANEGYARVTTGWAYFLVSLQQYLERGQGAPAPDIDFARMLR